MGRCLSAMCRTGSGGDTYCAVSALFDIAGSMSRCGTSTEVEENVFPFLIMPSNIMKQGEDVGPVRVEVGQGEAKIRTTTMLDVHLAAEVMKGREEEGGTLEPLIVLRAGVEEVVSLDVSKRDRKRFLTLELC